MKYFQMNSIKTWRLTRIISPYIADVYKNWNHSPYCCFESQNIHYLKNLGVLFLFIMILLYCNTNSHSYLLNKIFFILLDGYICTVRFRQVTAQSESKNNSLYQIVSVFLNLIQWHYKSHSYYNQLKEREEYIAYIYKD